MLKICRVGLCTELFYAVIPTLFPLGFFSILLSIHLATVLRFLSLVYVTFFVGILAEVCNQSESSKDLSSQASSCTMGFCPTTQSMWFHKASSPYLYTHWPYF